MTHARGDAVFVWNGLVGEQPTLLSRETFARYVEEVDAAEPDLATLASHGERQQDVGCSGSPLRARDRPTNRTPKGT
jgi:hypothetical protein